jgi:hypothetical protein
MFEQLDQLIRLDEHINDEENATKKNINLNNIFDLLNKILLQVKHVFVQQLLHLFDLDVILTMYVKSL